MTDAEEWRSAAAQVIERFFGQITYLPMTNSEHSSAEVTPSRVSIMVNRASVRSLQQSLFVRFHLFATFLPTIRHAKNVHVRTNVRSGINKYFERLSNLCTVQSIQGMLRKKLRNNFCSRRRKYRYIYFANNPRRHFVARARCTRKEVGTILYDFIRRLDLIKIYTMEI